MRNRISLPKDVHKSHIEMTKHSNILSRVYSPPFCQEQTKGQGETRVRDEGTRDEGTNNDNEGCKINNKMKFKQKTKKKKKKLQSIR